MNFGYDAITPIIYHAAYVVMEYQYICVYCSMRWSKVPHYPYLETPP